MAEQNDNETPTGRAVTGITLACLAVGVLVGFVFWMDAFFADDPHGLHAVLVKASGYLAPLMAFVLPMLVFVTGLGAREGTGLRLFKAAWASSIAIDAVLLAALFAATS